MINILFVEPGSGYGGSFSYLHSFLKYLNRTNFNPVVALYSYANGPQVKKINDLGVRVIFLKRHIGF